MDVKVIFAKWYAPNGGVATTRPGGLNTPSDFVDFLLEGKNGIAEGNEKQAKDFLKENAQMFSLSAYQSDEEVRSLVKFGLKKQKSIDALSSFTSKTPIIYALALEGPKEELEALANAFNITKFVEVNARGEAATRKPAFISERLELSALSTSPDAISTDEYLKFREIAAQQYGIELGGQ